MEKKLILFLMLACFYANCLNAEEQQIATGPQPSTQGPNQSQTSENINNGALSLSAGIDWLSQYIDRGIFIENQGFLTQPWVEIYATLYEGEGFLREVSFMMGTWHSIHSSCPSGTGSAVNDPQALYESDFYMTLSLGMLDFLEFKSTYMICGSPNDQFKTIQELDFELSATWSFLDDKVSITPLILLAVELDGANDGGREGIYLGLSLTPRWEVLKEEKYGLTLSFPMTLGFSLHRYYDYGTKDDDPFGYASLGLAATIPLLFIPARYGAWEFRAGVEFLILDGNTEEHNEPANDDFEVIGKIGFALNY